MSTRPDDHRRKWDKKEFERKALDRVQKTKKNEEPQETPKVSPIPHLPCL